MVKASVPWREASKKARFEKGSTKYLVALVFFSDFDSTVSFVLLYRIHHLFSSAARARYKIDFEGRAGDIYFPSKQASAGKSCLLILDVVIHVEYLLISPLLFSRDNGCRLRIKQSTMDWEQRTVGRISLVLPLSRLLWSTILVLVPIQGYG
jgi:hypothetical protein